MTRFSVFTAIICSFTIFFSFSAFGQSVDWDSALKNFESIDGKFGRYKMDFDYDKDSDSKTLSERVKMLGFMIRYHDTDLEVLLNRRLKERFLLYDQLLRLDDSDVRRADLMVKQLDQLRIIFEHLNEEFKRFENKDFRPEYIVSTGRDFDNYFGPEIDCLQQVRGLIVYRLTISQYYKLVDGLDVGYLQEMQSK